MSVSVSAHQVASITEQEHAGASGGSKWREYIFKDAEGKRVLEVTVFHSELEGDLESTVLPYNPS